MAAGRMTADEQRLAGAVPQKYAGLTDLIDDLRDRNLRTQVVADHSDIDPVGVQPCRHVAKAFALQRAPPATMNEERERCICAPARGKNIDNLPLTRPIAQAELGALLGHRLLPIGLRIACPSREDLRMLGYPRAIVVFLFVIDDRHRNPASRTLVYPNPYNAAGLSTSTLRRVASSGTQSSSTSRRRASSGFGLAVTGVGCGQLVAHSIR